MNYLKRALRIIPAIILLQTLFFKFTAHPESVALFTKIGMEPYGRVGVGVLEFIAGILVLIPSLSMYGAILIIWLMLGAVYFHITILWYNELFVLAVIALSCATVIIYQEKQLIINLFHKIFDE